MTHLTNKNKNEKNHKFKYKHKFNYRGSLKTYAHRGARVCQNLKSPCNQNTSLGAFSNYTDIKK